MRISDWSSDVCSSDLDRHGVFPFTKRISAGKSTGGACSVRRQESTRKGYQLSVAGDVSLPNMAHFREKSRMWPFAPRRSAVLARLPLPHRHATENILPSITSLHRRRRPRSGGRSKVQAPLRSEEP